MRWRNCCIWRADAEADRRIGAKGIGNPKALLDFLVEAVPPAAAVLSTLTYLVNLWLGGRIVKFSGRLNRPWPKLSAMAYPRAMTAALGIAVVLSFAPGLLGIFAGVAAAALLIAFGVLGFAVLHALTETMQSRGFVLGGTYAAVLVFGWPVLAMALLGLADMFFDLRGRAARPARRPTDTVLTFSFKFRNSFQPFQPQTSSDQKE